MPRMKSGKHLETIVCGRELFARFKFWLTHTRREKKVDPWWDTCRSFCPTCKWYNQCNYLLNDMEVSNEYLEVICRGTSNK